MISVDPAMYVHVKFDSRYRSQLCPDPHEIFPDGGVFGDYRRMFMIWRLSRGNN